MTNAEIVPLSVWAKSPPELTKAIAQLQAKAGCKFLIIAIYPYKNGHLAWYYSNTNNGMSL